MAGRGMGERFGAAVVRAARAWVGTPYRHGASAVGAGADCLGLIRGVWRAVYGREPEAAPPYGPDGDGWAEAAALRAALGRHADETPVETAVAGDVLLMRLGARGPAKHLAVLATDAGGAPTMIHAYSGVGVVESPLGETWARRIVAAFRLREAR
ncbi:MAG: peptidase [Rhodobacteraceae bacterium]|nr:MAG: peptidase [Paracoccaceae bacterium]